MRVCSRGTLQQGSNILIPDSLPKDQRGEPVRSPEAEHRVGSWVNVSPECPLNQVPNLRFSVATPIVPVIGLLQETLEETNPKPLEP